MSSSKFGANRKRMERRNRPPSGESWIWITEEMLASPAWRSLSGASLRSLSRMMLEQVQHAGSENGNLPVTYDNFEAYGVRRKSVRGALTQLVALGFVDVRERGRPGAGIGRSPAKYSLTWLPTADGDPPTNRWKAIKSLNEARRAIAAVEGASKRTRPAAGDVVVPIRERRGTGTNG